MIRHTSMAMRDPRRRALGGLAALVVLALVVTACSGDDDADVTSTEGSRAPAEAFDAAVDEPAQPEAAERDMGADGDMAADDGEQDMATSSADGALAAAGAGRRVIRTATLELEVENTAEAADRIVAITTAAGSTSGT